MDLDLSSKASGVDHSASPLRVLDCNLSETSGTVNSQLTRSTPEASEHSDDSGRSSLRIVDLDG